MNEIVWKDSEDEKNIETHVRRFQFLIKIFDTLISYQKESKTDEKKLDKFCSFLVEPIMDSYNEKFTFFVPEYELAEEYVRKICAPEKSYFKLSSLLGVIWVILFFIGLPLNNNYKEWQFWSLCFSFAFFIYFTYYRFFHKGKMDLTWYMFHRFIKKNEVINALEIEMNTIKQLSEETK